jgi:hypothetical protein
MALVCQDGAVVTAEDVIRSEEPFDRLTRLTVQMTEPLEQSENDDVQAIIFLHDGERSGIQIHGYDDTHDAMADLFIHMKAIFKSMGKDLDFIGVPESPKGLDGL